MIVSEEQVQNVLKMQRDLKVENRHAAKTCNNRTKLPIISSAQDLNLASASLAKAPEVREEKVAIIKDYIKQGKYQPAATHIASKMVNRSLVDNTLIKTNFE